MIRSLLTAAAVAVGLSWAPSVTIAEQVAPKEHKGLKTLKTQIVDLGPEIPGMEGRQLRLRLLQIEPGGHTNIHSHKDRPSVVYFLQGTDTVILGDGTSRTFHAGDTTSANRNTMHWHRNDGKDAVLLIAADILKVKK